MVRHQWEPEGYRHVKLEYEFPKFLLGTPIFVILLRICGVLTCSPAEDSGLLHLVYSCAAEKHNTAPFPSHDVPIVPRKAPVIG